MPSIVGSSEGRAGSGRIRSTGGTAVFEESYAYIVLADNTSQTRLEILQTTSLPVVGQTTGPSGFTVCKSLSAARRPNQTLYWDVKAEFSSEVEEGDGESDPSNDPNAWTPVYETKFERLQEVVAKDLAKKPVVNSVGAAFETGLTISRFIPVWEFYQFEPATVTDETIIARNETINSGTFKGRNPKTLLLTVMSSVRGFYYGQARRLTQYGLKYNDRKWTHKRLDVGTTFLDSSGDEKSYKVKDIDGEKTEILGTLYDWQGNNPGVEKDESKKGQPSGGYDGDGNPLQDADKVGVLEFEIYTQSNFSFLRT